MSSRTEMNKEKQEEIMAEEKREQRKKYVILFLKITFILIVSFLGFYLYTENISTTKLIVKEERITNNKIPTSFNGIKVIHFSDLYYGSTITEKEVTTLIQEINKRNPDIVIFTGNLFTNNLKVTTKQQEKMIKQLGKINATIGKYAVMGKSDEKDTFTTIMNQSNFTVLENQYDLIYSNDNSPILLVGLSSLIKNTRDKDAAYQYFKEETHNSEIYTISIMSETDDLDEILLNYQTDLVLAGNSLNGEIRIPFLGGVIKQEGSSTYKNAFYQKGNTTIYVSGGLGSPNTGFRLFNHPSINFFRLSNKN